MSWYDVYPDIFKEVLSKIFLDGFFDEYDKEKYTISNSGISINIEVLESSLCIQNKKFEKDNAFPYLKNKKCADSVIIQKVKDNTYIYNIHIFELTKKRKKEKELCEQFEGACLRVLAVLSYFRNIKLNKVLLYFVRKETNTNPIFCKSMILNTKVLTDELEIENNTYTDELEIENNTYTFEQNKLKIKLLKDGETYNIRNICSEYEININKNISHLI